MKMRVVTGVLGIICTLASLTGGYAADQTVTQGLGILEEKVGRLTAQIEDLQVRQQQTQKDLDKIQTELAELRRAAAGTVSAAELKSLEDRIQAVDVARQKDRQAIIEQLAKELAALSAGKPPGKSTVPADSKEHVVQKGEYLSSIARKYGVSIADLKKANNLTGDDIKPGQKLTIPK